MSWLEWWTAPTGASSRDDGSTCEVVSSPRRVWGPGGVDTLGGPFRSVLRRTRQTEVDGPGLLWISKGTWSLPLRLGARASAGDGVWLDAGTVRPESEGAEAWWVGLHPSLGLIAPWVTRRPTTQRVWNPVSSCELRLLAGRWGAGPGVASPIFGVRACVLQMRAGGRRWIPSRVTYPSMVACLHGQLDLGGGLHLLPGEVAVYESEAGMSIAVPRGVGMADALVLEAPRVEEV